MDPPVSEPSAAETAAAEQTAPGTADTPSATPVKAKRQSMGIFVMLFLLVFFAFAYMLKKEYWKDVH